MREHFRKLENMYHDAPVNEHYQPILEVRKGAAVITMEVNPAFFHAGKALHGSVYFKALDDAAFFAANSLVERFMVLTATFNIYLLRPVTSGTLRAEGKVTSASKNLYVAESALYLDGDQQVARGSGTFMRSRLSLAEIDAYREPTV